MAITAAQFRANLNKLLDEVIETGTPLEVERNGTILRIVPPRKKRDLTKLPRARKIVSGDAESIVHMDWAKNWKAFL